jgi:hypothetical protein
MNESHVWEARLSEEAHVCQLRSGLKAFRGVGGLGDSAEMFQTQHLASNKSVQSIQEVKTVKKKFTKAIVDQPQSWNETNRRVVFPRISALG